MAQTTKDLILATLSEISGRSVYEHHIVYVTPKRYREMIESLQEVE